VEALNPAGSMHHKETVTICSVLTCPDTKDLSRLLPERNKSNDAIFHHVTPFCHDFRVTIDGFGLVIGFIGLFETARDYILQYSVSHPH
jgi:hypothetical protein